MTSYAFALPTKTPGVYGIRHTKTQRIYIGSTTSLYRRFCEWRAMFQSGHFSASRGHAEAFRVGAVEEWEFVVIEGHRNDTKLESRERHFIKGIHKASPGLLLNTVSLDGVPQSGFGKSKGSQRASRVWDGNRELTYGEAANLLGISTLTVTKRLKAYREAGVMEMDIAMLRSRRPGRPRKTPTP